VLNRTYDQDYQLTAQQVGTWQSQYRHDANGNITAHAHSLFGSINYRYDALDRLTMEEAGLRKTYTYDANGNRTSRTTAHTSLGITYFQHRLRYAPDSNRLLQSDSLYEAEVDAAGNYTRHTLSKRYQYDDQGRLSNVIDQRGNGVARYTYNALGQRVLKEARQGTNRLPFTYLYGPNGQVLGQVSYTAQGRKSKASYYVWLDDLPIAQIDLAYNFAGTVVDSTTLTYLHSDHLNTPRLATNQSGNLVWSWQSDAFGIGQPKTHGSTIDVILRFPGQIADAHSGLYYNYFRDYDPETGRYVESDPIGLLDNLNTYSYVYGNPLNYSDPRGLCGVGSSMEIYFDRYKGFQTRCVLDSPPPNLEAKCMTAECVMRNGDGRDTRGTPNCQIMCRIPTIPCALAGGPLTPQGIACRASVTAVMCSTICDKNEEIKQCQNEK
ncbi:RHS repeat domain-containing protein, partial [Metapseudomonas otitidis]|uniref:RHS repeat domain-containing protein n=1 Tax=Metapseudomonas otitidis TaxID=319939 RepID=UPI0023F76A97